MIESNEPLNAGSGDTLQDDLDSLAKERQGSVLLINGRMNDAYTQFVSRHIAPMYEGYSRLSVLLNSPGGSARPTYRMILALRQYVDEIEVLVPRRAKSAATFFCLGADRIFMGTEGELGPLDPQIRDRGEASDPFPHLSHLRLLSSYLNNLWIPLTR